MAGGTGGRQESVFDLGRLSDLKRDVKHDPDGTAQQKQVAKQFEALFLQMMLKRMREATPKEGLFDSQQSQMMQSMADEQLALHLATPGIGLSQAILGQMKQGKPGELSADAVKRIGQGSDLDYATGGSRQVSALLGVLRNNRASDRAMAAAEGAPEHVVSFVSRMSHAANLAAQQSGVPARVILARRRWNRAGASARSSIRMVAPATTCLASRPAPAGRGRWCTCSRPNTKTAWRKGDATFPRLLVL